MTRALLVCGALVVGCSSAEVRAPAQSVEVETPETPDALALRAVEWNVAKADLGAVAALVEGDAGLTLFGEKGAISMAGGAVRSIVPGPKAWRDAAVVPAADGLGDWTVGVTSGGAVFRLHGDALEDVTPRYGLSRVRTVLRLDDKRVAFGFDGGVALTTDTRVELFAGPANGVLTAGGGKLAWIDGDVKVLTLADRKVRSFPIARASSVALDERGHLAIAAESTLWVEDDRGLWPRWEAPATVGALSFAGGRLWMTVGTELGTLTGGRLALSKGAALAADAQLRATGKGDVWVLATTGVRKFGGSAPSEVLADWQAHAQPIYARACAGCHAPGGTAGIDLSTLAGWTAHRDALERRVLVDKTMPPSGIPFTDADRAAVRDWLSRN